MDTEQVESTAHDAPGATISERDDPQHVEDQDALALGRSVSIETACQLKGWSRRTVYYRIADGTLETVMTKHNGSRRVLVASLMAAPARKG